MQYPLLWTTDVERRIRAEAVNLDEQGTTAPENTKMCVRCVVTSARPRITFDADGVCSACRHHERKYNGSIDWEARAQELKDLLGLEVRGKAVRGAARIGKDIYNVIVPASGGKDSSFVASTLRNMGMTPLLARWAPHAATDIGERNWQALLHAGFDGVTAQPNGLLHRKLSRLALEFYGDGFVPFIFGQLCWPFHAAVHNNTKLVFYGECGEAEYGGDTSAADKPCWDDADWERVYMKGANLQKLLDIGKELGAISDEEASRASPFYSLPQVDDRPEFHWLGYYLPWHPQNNYYHAVENTGFEPCEQRSEGTFSRYASIDDILDGLHYRLAVCKFGIGRCTSDAAQEVRNGELTRDEALALVAKYDKEFPVRNFATALDYLGIHDPEHYFKIEERFSIDIETVSDARRAVLAEGGGR